MFRVQVVGTGVDPTRRRYNENGTFIVWEESRAGKASSKGGT